jgi:2-C-methyl-D-erythritol 4-phosphate cytidylyltransferase
MLTAIIVAGGSGRRMGFDKTFALLRDQPVIAHSMAAFEATDCVGDIIVVGREDRLDELRALVRNGSFAKVNHVIAGGVHRQDSVRAGLDALSVNCRYVAVHDAARPLITPPQIAAVFEAAKAHGAASLAAPVVDTLKRVDDAGFVCESLERERVFGMQTPQIFARDLLVDAYDAVNAANLPITDEVSAVQHLGRKVLLMSATEPNFMITFPGDLALAEMVLAGRRAVA